MTDPRNQYFYQNGTTNFPAPIFENNSLMMSFIFSSDMNTLQKVCDNWLNLPTNNELYYHPLAPVVMVTFANNKGNYPKAEPYCNWGLIAYQEVIFSIFVVRVKKMGDLWIAENISMIIPYFFVTDGMVLINGRENYGMPKAMANIKAPTIATDPDKTFELSAVSAATFQPGVVFKENLLASIVQTSIDAPAPKSEWKSMGEAAKVLKNLIFGKGHIEIPGLGLVVEMAESLFEGTQYTALRQVRSLSTPSETVYKEVVEFGTKTEKFNGGGFFPGTYQIKLPPNALYPFAQDLGLKDGQTANLAFWIDWNFLAETGKEIWTSTAPAKTTLGEKIANLF